VFSLYDLLAEKTSDDGHERGLARHLPYGEKSERFIRERAFVIAGFLLGKAAAHGIAVPVNQGLYQAVKEKR